MKKLTLSIILTMLCCMSLSAQLKITELMQSNVDCIMDDLNDFPDSWIELYNEQLSAVNLKEYSIGVSQNAKEAYRLPDQLVLPQHYVLIYCDKENKGLHTTFRLDADEGGAVYLLKGNDIIDKVEGIPEQLAPNVSYGRRVDDINTWGHFVRATPGEANSHDMAKGVLPPVDVSVPGCVMENKQTLKVALKCEGNPETDYPQKGIEIRYTLDGSEPIPNSPLYTTPITINSNRVLRAKPFCEGYASPRSTTHSYIFHPRNATLPVISIVSDSKYFYDNKIGILTEGNNGDKKNYQYNWRRPVNIEYFTQPDTASQINQLCETRVQGGASRGAKVKSLAVYAHKRFGKKRLKYEFFPEQRPGIKNFKSLVLRNAGNDFDYLYMRDAVIQRSVAQNVDLDWQAYQPAIFYLNGQYIGMLNIRERSNEDNIFTNYDGLEDIDLFENWWDKKTGTWDKMNEFKAFYQEHGHTWEEYSKLMDLEEYINLMIMNIYFDNKDFPANNIAMWRPRTDDGRWRFIAKDTDFGLGLYGTNPSYNTIAWIYDNGYDSQHSWGNTADGTRLFRRLMEDEDFKREFIDRAATYMGDFLTYGRIWDEIWQPMYEAIKYEYPYHRELINKWWPKYTDELQGAQSWLKNRNSYFYRYLSEYYHLGAPQKLIISTNNPTHLDEGFHLTINGVKLTRTKFDGMWFKGRRVVVSAENNNETDTHVEAWEYIEVSKTGKVNNKHIINDSGCLEFDMPECAHVTIKAILSNENVDIADVENKANADSNIYNLNGQRLSSLKKGINIVGGKKILY